MEILGRDCWNQVAQYLCFVDLMSLLNACPRLWSMIDRKWIDARSVIERGLKAQDLDVDFFNRVLNICTNPNEKLEPVQRRVFFFGGGLLKILYGYSDFSYSVSNDNKKQIQKEDPWQDSDFDLLHVLPNNNNNNNNKYIRLEELEVAYPEEVIDDTGSSIENKEKQMYRLQRTSSYDRIKEAFFDLSSFPDNHLKRQWWCRTSYIDHLTILEPCNTIGQWLEDSVDFPIFQCFYDGTHIRIKHFNDLWQRSSQVSYSKLLRTGVHGHRTIDSVWYNSLSRIGKYRERNISLKVTGMDSMWQIMTRYHLDSDFKRTRFIRMNYAIRYRPINEDNCEMYTDYVWDLMCKMNSIKKRSIGPVDIGELNYERGYDLTFPTKIRDIRLRKERGEIDRVKPVEISDEDWIWARTFTSWETADLAYKYGSNKSD